MCRVTAILNISIVSIFIFFEIEMNINFSSFVIESITKTSYLRSFHIVNFPGLKQLPVPIDMF